MIEEVKTICYTADARIEVDTSSAQFPVDIEFEFRNVDRAVPTKRKLVLSSVYALATQKISFVQEEVDSLAAFYNALHKKVPALPPNNHFLIFIDVNEPATYNGFVADDTHVILMAVKCKSAIVAILNATYFERAIKVRGDYIIPPCLVDVLNSPPPEQSQTARIINSAKARNIDLRTRIINDAQSPGIIDVKRPMSTIAVDPYDPDIACIPVCPKFKSLFIALNATLVCINTHLVPRGRTLEVDEELVREVVTTIIEEHTIGNEEDDEDDENDEEEDAINS